MELNLRKRKHDHGADSDFHSSAEDPNSDAMDLDADDSDESVKQFTRRSSRKAVETTNVVKRRPPPESEYDVPPARPSRALRPRSSVFYGTDIVRDAPNVNSNKAEDDDFLPVVSDLAPPRRGRRPARSRSRKSVQTRVRSGSGSDIEFEPLRRSSRANKNNTIMNDEIDFDDDDFEVGSVPKERGALKVISVKEIFQPISAESPFGAAHMQKCHTCGGSKQKGQLIYCQGCSITFHKSCIGYRSAREHLVTKVAAEFFVLQCKYCIGLYTARDETAPRYDRCQECRRPGDSCAAFSKKLTSRQEEKLREENDGVDPIAGVEPDRVNNGKNVLFRCQDCHRGWHQHHLPTQDGIKSDLPSSNSKRFRCEDCQSATHKIHRLVAWRLVNPDTQIKGKLLLSWQDVSEDDKEYLVKWDTKSYAHCTWLPGAWIFGVTAATMRKSFGKRDLEQSLLKPDEKDAIPEEYMAPDIILVAKMASNAPRASSKEEMLANISQVRRIFVKFQGLGYEDVVWDAPPSPEMTTLYQAFVDAYGEYVNGKYFHQESATTLRSRIEGFKAGSCEELQEQPEGIRRGKLMGYQLEGLNWLLENFHQGRSVVLADEMGLGKTVQVVSFITSLVQDDPKVRLLYRFYTPTGLITLVLAFSHCCSKRNMPQLAARIQTMGPRPSSRCLPWRQGGARAYLQL